MRCLLHWSAGRSSSARELGLDETYSGVEEVTGEVVSTEVNGRTYFVEEVDDEKRPFRALLDVGIKNTTTGARFSVP
ncbi:unnamed protein product [Pylaiella littoralis]